MTIVDFTENRSSLLHSGKSDLMKLRVDFPAKKNSNQDEIHFGQISKYGLANRVYL